MSDTREDLKLELLCKEYDTDEETMHEDSLMDGVCPACSTNSVKSGLILMSVI